MNWWLSGGVGVLLVSGLLVARGWFRLVTVTGVSMTPVLCRGDVVLVRRSRRSRRGDIALLRLPPRNTGAMVKRVVAVGGDAVPDDLRHAVGVPVVPAGMLLVRGTTDDSFDSRRFGAVPLSDVEGVVVAVIRRAAHDG